MQLASFAMDWYDWGFAAEHTSVEDRTSIIVRSNKVSGHMISFLLRLGDRPRAGSLDTRILVLRGN